MLRQGIGSLIEKYNKLDDAGKKELMHEIKESRQMPEEIKEQFISAMEEEF